jgi:lipoprotein-releasing system permease protein
MSEDRVMGQGSWVPFEPFVAIRFLKEGLVQTLFIIGGISIGVGVIIFMSALLTGLKSNFVNRVLTGQAHIQVIAPKEVVRAMRSSGDRDVVQSTLQSPLQRLKSIDQWQSIAAQIAQMPWVSVVSPAATGAALVIRGSASQSVNLMGIVPDLYYQIVPLPEKIVQGRAVLSGEDVLIGTELASILGVTVGDKISLSSATGSFNVLTLRGIFDLGNKGANTRTVYVAMRSAQSLLNLTGVATVLDVTLQDVYQAENIAQKITAMTQMQADSWIKTNEQFFTAIGAQTTANTAIRFFVALSVGFGIASVLVVSVVQRSSDIGILRAMGIKRSQILRIFLIQGGLLGLGGALVGACLGASALLLWEVFMRNADGTVMFVLELDGALFLQALALATLTGLLAAFAPALRAARLDPVVAMRG